MVPSVDCIDREQDFAALGAEWNGLLAGSASNNLFLTWEWISTWWEVYGPGSHLYVLTARDEDGTLLGIAPLKRRSSGVLGLGRVDVLEFIGFGGDVTPEQLDFIVRRGAEADVATAFVEYIEHDPRVHGLDLRPFATSSPNLPFVAPVLQASPGYLQQTRDAICPILPLPETREAFAAGRSRNYRKKMREYQRRCERDLDAHVRLSATQAELDRDMTTLVALHHKRWDGRSRAFRTAAYVAFHRQLARRLFDEGHVRMFALDSSRGPLAVLYCFSYGDRYYYYQAGRDPDPDVSRLRVGLVLMHCAIEHAIGEHARVFDFLRGDEAYKYTWATEQASAVRVAHFKTWPARAMSALAAVISGASSSLTSSAAMLVGAAAETWSRLLSAL